MMLHDCKGKVKYAAFEPKWLIRPALISGFCSIKQLGSPSQQLPVHHKVIPALNWPVPIYTPRWREALKVKCLTQEQNTMSLVWGPFLRSPGNLTGLCNHNLKSKSQEK